MIKYNFTIPEAKRDALSDFIKEGHIKVLELQKKEVLDFLTKKGLTIETVNFDNVPGYIESRIRYNKDGKPYYGCGASSEGNLTYSFTIGGIGTGISVTNNLTGDVLDLTNYDEW